MQKMNIIWILIVMLNAPVIIAMENDMPDTLNSYIVERLEKTVEIPKSRQEILDTLSSWINQKVMADSTANLVFICTHNSRRSHMAQIWAQTAAHYFRVPGVQCYSGGTEATAFNPRSVKAMLNAGFEVEKITDDDNPVYHVIFSSQADTIKAWSKTFDDSSNPQENFAAIMTCSDADQACPIVPGAEARFAVTYQDPKQFDNTPMEKAKYDERCAQIATEMLYVFAKIGGVR